MKHIVGFSGGVASAVCAHLIMKEEHSKDVVLLFHDTKTEPEDNTRFRREVSEFLQCPVTEDSDGRNIWQVFKDEGFLGNDLHDICSRILKRDRSKAFLKANMPATLYLGFSLEEHRRAQRTFARYAKQGVEVKFPLIEHGISKDECHYIVKNCWKIKPQKIYAWADHANCIPCVRGQLTYWGLIYMFHREAWEIAAKAEEEIGNTIFNPNQHGSLREEREHCLKLAEKFLKKRETERRQMSLFSYPCECAL